MLGEIRINPLMAPHLPDAKKLERDLEDVTDKFLEDQAKKAGPDGTRVMTWKEYDSGIIEVVNKTIDLEIDQPLRSYVVAKIHRGDEGVDDCVLEVTWDDSKIHFHLPNLTIEGKPITH